MSDYTNISKYVLENHIQYKDVFLGIYMIYMICIIHPCNVNANYTTELVVEVATICMVNISSDILLKFQDIMPNCSLVILEGL